MEDMPKEKAREMVLMKSMRVKPKLMKMGEDALMMGKDSAMGRARCVLREREFTGCADTLLHRSFLLWEGGLVRAQMIGGQFCGDASLQALCERA